MTAASGRRTIGRHDRRSGMIIELAAATIGIAIAAFAVTLGMVLLLARALRSIDRAAEPDDDDTAPGDGGSKRPPYRPSGPGGEPAWWPEFERQLAEYVTRARRPGPVDV
jgi:hypothetical protein